MQPVDTTKPIIVPRPDHNLSRALVDDDALWLMRKLRKAGFKAFLVGGAVRDILLGNEPKDFDIGTDATPSQIKSLFRNCRLIGRRFRLAHVYFRRKGAQDKIIEVSTFRGDRPMEDTSGLKPEDLDLSGNAFGSPAEDAWRRDFTVNAMFYDISDFSIIDHTGGLDDLKKGVIKLIGEPDVRFTEDPVRMLRALEFAVRLDFAIDPGTEAGIKSNATGILAASQARLREEFRHMQQRGIMGPVLRWAHRLGLFSPLFSQAEVTDGVFELLDHYDRGGNDKRNSMEYVYVASLVMPTIVASCPLGPDTGLDTATEAVAGPTTALCSNYQISAHIRHKARELILGCYRLAKGRSYKAKAKFSRKAEFMNSFELLKCWNTINDGEYDEVVQFWDGYLAERDTPQQVQAKRRRPRRRRRPRPASKPTSES